MNACVPLLAALLLAAAAAPPARADTTQARCDIVPRGASRPVAVMACSFSQRQGYVSIARADGIRHELSPDGQPGAAIGNYTDETGAPACRSSAPGRRGLSFRLAQETVQVYWDTTGVPAGAPRYRRTLRLQGIGFGVVSDKVGGRQRVTVTPAGLQRDNTPQVREIEGAVVGAEVADLNADGSPELYVFLMGTGERGAGSLLAFSANRRRSLSDIHLPEPVAGSDTWKGWRGGDRFAVVEHTLVRRFRVYREDDRDGMPTGGWRQVQYKLEAGEAGWQLRLGRVVDF